MGVLWSTEEQAACDEISAVGLFNMLQDLRRVVILFDLQASSGLLLPPIDGAIPVAIGSRKRNLEQQILAFVASKLEGMNGFLDVDFLAYGAEEPQTYRTLAGMVRRLFPSERPTSPQRRQNGGRALCKSFVGLRTPFTELRAAYPFICVDGGSYEEGRLYASHVLPQVFLSNYGVACDAHTIRSMQITHVVNCTPDLPFACTSGPDATRNMRISVTDIADDASKMSSFFDSAAAFMHAAIQECLENRVLVHCKHGQSRSATIIVAYMLQWRPDLVVNCRAPSPFDETAAAAVQEAIKYLQSHRPRVAPNPAFVEQLEDFARRCEESGKFQQ
eukprot:TRINITY_DN112210_c0_g1_i1.p1 TRINITY_DN112210_c0_g1~~TRINITY_DN112210_c0_g1_i1.p1  ORF type:complete len:332 (-),score=43.76 TRINITY_DN112210_c0_g1_i1:182-1177(-)